MVNTSLSPVQPPPVSGTGATFATRSIQNIGDELAATGGLSQNGTLANALQIQGTGTATSAPNPNSVLAAQLYPSVNLSPSTSLQVTDYINVAQNAFPTSSPAAAAQTAQQQASSTTPIAPATDSSGQTDTTQAANGFDATSATSAPAPTPAPAAADSGGDTQSSYSGDQGASGGGIYNALANASASTIRGSSVNIVA